MLPSIKITLIKKMKATTNNPRTLFVLGLFLKIDFLLCKPRKTRVRVFS